MHSRVRGRCTRHDALDREAAAVASGAAGVGDEPVALDHDRPVGLGDLDRDVRHARARVREAVVPVGDRPAAPRADDELAVDERLASTAPVKNASVLPPSPAAGTRSGTSCASAPFIDVGEPVARDAAHRGRARHDTCMTVPGFVITVIGRSRPARARDVDRAMPPSRSW